jgi:quercetin dioxygenase-like cupin family protein
VTDERERNRPAWVFNIKDDTQGIPRVLGDGLSARIFVGDNVMLSVVRAEPHSEGAVHSHPEEQWGLLLEGECIRIQGDEDFHMKAGDFWHTPGGMRHGLRTGDVGAIVLDIFSPPRKEYRKTGEGFGQSA